MNGKQPKTVSVSVELAYKIDQLNEALKAEFGCDYSYTICGKGVILGASNMVNGHVKPTIKPKA
jgi:hypothetical protein